MASAAVASWTAFIKDLQKCVFGDPTAPGSAKLIERMDKEVQSLSQTFPGASVPSAAWKKLVRDVQVQSYNSQGCGGMDLLVHVHTEPNSASTPFLYNSLQKMRHLIPAVSPMVGAAYPLDPGTHLHPFLVLLLFFRLCVSLQHCASRRTSTAQHKSRPQLPPPWGCG
jgi:hypothetical protein